ncbi:Putative acetolactate synthase large subunit IlvX [Methylobacterium crusticola]|uniref:Acetolactate synthase large subunit IlvX n=1 Tax=Methylobacterium crusticola TaxID=1697972 RepID=A0ABQ4QUA6_9HYPH|nr:acetolactate synthase large subunit [Methylobacterium crusticola]GJD48809.1 Putative acetolactate synthase large subunit IlvX [Methylobacterium crusticola]
MAMNGAESLVRTLVAGGVEVCFTNPGTSEMHFVAALDRVDGMRAVLCLFEGAATGAADGYARMADKPASTLLHLGPGLGNGIANLHNARRARSPVVNIVGEHATYHRVFDAPLTSDIEGLAGPVSAWVRTGLSAAAVAADGAAAVTAARTAPGGVATLILPADTAWEEGTGIAAVPPPPERARASDEAVTHALAALRSGEPVLLHLGDRAVRGEGRRIAARIAQATGAKLLAMTSNARIDRGAGTVPIDRLPYPVDPARAALETYRHIILVGATLPVAFFAYPGKPSALAPATCDVFALATPEQDQIDALERLAAAVGAPAEPSLPAGPRPELPGGDLLDQDTVGRVLGAMIPEGAIICDESVTTGRNFFASTHASAPHTWLQLTGGSIGLGIPMATGAAVACPDRKVISLQADGSALYTAQALWTQARERLDVVTLIWSNRSYAILKLELANVGANPGRKALDMLTLDDPPVDWVSLARGYGVEGRRVERLPDLVDVLRGALKRRGPFLIEVAL